jgi:hypothetical protein
MHYGNGRNGLDGNFGNPGNGAKAGLIWLTSVMGMYQVKNGKMDPGIYNHGNPGLQIKDIVRPT